MTLDEQYIFTPETKKKIVYLLVFGLALFFIGVWMAKSGVHHESHEHASIQKDLTASLTNAHGEEHAHAEHHGAPVWLKRIYTSLWHNNIFFAGLGIIGLFFIAIQYAAQAGWSAPLKRIPMAMGHWIPFAGLLMIIFWFAFGHDLFHWTHASLFDPKSEDFDKAINGKGGFFYWPMAKGTFPFFFVARMIAFFGLWYLFFIWIKKEMLAEDLNGGIQHWTTARKLAAIFLVFFGYSSSVAAWDWVMSIDTHWFSTMMGWYVFASWHVTGLAMITLIVSRLKEAGYLKMVNANHLHDLGKFVFAFSIFWTYIWFSQFLLIYYANIPEETVYFISRINHSPYSWVFYLNLIMNFVLPFLLLMTRDAKRHTAVLALVCPIVIAGHWFDFYNMITPGVMKGEGAFGLLEIGLAFVFLAAYLWVILSALAKHPLVAKQHPMMQESLHHHI